MVSLDLSLSKDFLNTSLKLFDGELSFRERKDSGLKTNSSDTFRRIDNFKYGFCKFFSEIELINNKLIVFDKNNVKFEYLIDLIYDDKGIKGLLSQYYNPTKT